MLPSVTIRQPRGAFQQHLLSLPMGWHPKQPSRLHPGHSLGSTPLPCGPFPGDSRMLPPGHLSPWSPWGLPQPDCKHLGLSLREDRMGVPTSLQQRQWDRNAFASEQTLCGLAQLPWLLIQETYFAVGGCRWLACPSLPTPLSEPGTGEWAAPPQAPGPAAPSGAACLLRQRSFSSREQ